MSRPPMPLPGQQGMQRPPMPAPGQGMVSSPHPLIVTPPTMEDDVVSLELDDNATGLDVLNHLCMHISLREVDI